MKLNEIREIVEFMKEAGVCELEYTERSTSIHLKLNPPAPVRPWDRLRTVAAPEVTEAPEAQDAEAVPEEELEDLGLSEAAEKVRQSAVKAGAVVVDTVKAGASFLKSKRDEYLAGSTPGAYDVELVEEDEAPQEPSAEKPAEQPREEMPVVGEVPEYVPKAAPEVTEAPKEAEAQPEAESEAEAEDVKLDTEAAKTAVTQAAEAVMNTAKAALELGAAGVRRGSSLVSDLLRRSDKTEASEADEDAESAEATEIDEDAEVCSACEAPVEPGTCETCEANEGPEKPEE